MAALTGGGRVHKSSTGVSLTLRCSHSRSYSLWPCFRARLSSFASNVRIELFRAIWFPIRCVLVVWLRLTVDGFPFQCHSLPHVDTRCERGTFRTHTVKALPQRLQSSLWPKDDIPSYVSLVTQPGAGLTTTQNWFSELRAVYVIWYPFFENLKISGRHVLPIRSSENEAFCFSTTNLFELDLFTAALVNVRDRHVEHQQLGECK